MVRWVQCDACTRPRAPGPARVDTHSTARGGADSLQQLAFLKHKTQRRFVEPFAPRPTCAVSPAANPQIFTPIPHLVLVQSCARCGKR